jgi:hypothetical protein
VDLQEVYYLLHPLRLVLDNLLHLHLNLLLRLQNHKNLLHLHHLYL